MAIRAYNAGLIDKGPDAKGEVIVRAERDKNNARAWKTGDEGLNRLCPEFKKKGNACAQPRGRTKSGSLNEPEKEEKEGRIISGITDKA